MLLDTYGKAASAERDVDVQLIAISSYRIITPKKTTIYFANERSILALNREIPGELGGRNGLTNKDD